MKVNVSTPMRLVLTEPATPARVAAVAQLVHRLLAAVGMSIGDGDVTLEISNFSTKASVRARSRQAREALQIVLAFLDDPHASNKKTKHLRTPIASVLAGTDLVGARFYRSRRQRPVATIDDDFLETMRDVATSASPRPLRGETVIESQVLRVGRSSEGGKPMIRVNLNGEPQEVRLAKSANVSEFFDAAKSGRTCEVRLDATWHRGLDGTLALDVRRTNALTVKVLTTSRSGTSFLDVFARTYPDAFADVDIDDMMASRL